MTDFNLENELTDLSARCSKYICYDYACLLKSLQTASSIKNQVKKNIEIECYMSSFQSIFDSFESKCTSAFHEASQNKTVIEWNSELIDESFGINEHHVNISGISAIEDFQFAGKNSISSVEIGSSVVRIGKNAFSDCKDLREVRINNSVMFIGADAFSGCSMLSSVRLPDHIIEIPQRCFKECEQLISIDIPCNVVSIQDSAFFGCTSMLSVHIPDSLMIIEPAAFKYCKSLLEISFPEEQHFAAIGQSFKNCISLSSLNVPATVFFIDPHAFSGCPIRVVDFQDEIDIKKYQATFKKYLYYKNVDNSLYD